MHASVFPARREPTDQVDAEGGAFGAVTPKDLPLSLYVTVDFEGLGHLEVCSPAGEKVRPLAGKQDYGSCHLSLP